MTIRTNPNSCPEPLLTLCQAWAKLACMFLTRNGLVTLAQTTRALFLVHEDGSWNYLFYGNANNIANWCFKYNISIWYTRHASILYLMVRTMIPFHNNVNLLPLIMERQNFTPLPVWRGGKKGLKKQKYISVVCVNATFLCQIANVDNYSSPFLVINHLIRYHDIALLD